MPDPARGGRPALAAATWALAAAATDASGTGGERDEVSFSSAERALGFDADPASGGRGDDGSPRIVARAVFSDDARTVVEVASGSRTPVARGGEAELGSGGGGSCGTEEGGRVRVRARRREKTQLEKSDVGNTAVLLDRRGTTAKGTPPPRGRADLARYPRGGRARTSTRLRGGGQASSSATYAPKIVSELSTDASAGGGARGVSAKGARARARFLGERVERSVRAAKAREPADAPGATVSIFDASSAASHRARWAPLAGILATS
jgi:hypothetical protein